MGYAKRKVRLVEETDEASVLDQIGRLYLAIGQCRGKPVADSRTAKLFAAGLPKMAQKLIEEAAEVAIEAVRGQRAKLRDESADLLYHLVVLWTALNITPEEVWEEMKRREAMMGIAEKVPKRLQSA
ncbi:MAG TPA: phosphoribosyl-ATP diphosphatase [Stellaceae bacterium]|nr:phosphoribosyl-ATP diphosphatase [Stellaceae bacterium]